MIATARALIVEDDALVARNLSRVVAHHGWSTSSAYTLAAARRALLAASGTPEAFDLVMIDLKPPDGDGSDLILFLASLVPRPAPLVVSGYLDDERLVKLWRRGVLALRKPVDCDALPATLRQVLDHHRHGRSIEPLLLHHGLTDRECAVLHLV